MMSRRFLTPEQVAAMFEAIIDKAGNVLIPDGEIPDALLAIAHALERSGYDETAACMFRELGLLQ